MTDNQEREAFERIAVCIMVREFGSVSYEGAESDDEVQAIYEADEDGREELKHFRDMAHEIWQAALSYRATKPQGDVVAMARKALEEVEILLDSAREMLDEQTNCNGTEEECIRCEASIRIAHAQSLLDREVKAAIATGATQQTVAKYDKNMVKVDGEKPKYGSDALAGFAHADKQIPEQPEAAHGNGCPSHGVSDPTFTDLSAMPQMPSEDAIMSLKTWLDRNLSVYDGTMGWGNEELARALLKHMRG
jgi:hypothetical protein